jgi:hypothetical protein
MLTTIELEAGQLPVHIRAKGSSGSAVAATGQ